MNIEQIILLIDNWHDLNQITFHSISSIRFFLFHFIYCRSNPVDADVLYLANRNRLESSNFNKSNAVIVYMHGFSEHVPGGPGQSSQEIRDGKSYFYNRWKLNGKEKKARVCVCAVCSVQCAIEM